MLRRRQLAAPGASAALPALCSVLCASQQGRLFHTSQAALNSGTSNSNPQQRSAADEDKEELERERNLREKFAEKIQQGIPQQPQQGGAGGGLGSGFGPGPAWGMGGGAGPMPGQAPFPPDAARKMFNFMFYLTAFMFLLVMAPLANQNSPMYTMQGLPWWELPLGSAAYFFLLRALYSRREQNRIKTEFENAARANPSLTFDQFMSHHYPTMFQGYRTSQPEMVAAVSACLSAAKDLKFAQTMVRAAGRAKDPRASTDDIMDALRRDFPQLF
ncbi:putative mitochondrial hypothetical protein [Leptomonas pyrrhocoris]|uniref:Uncharacterized protein n=1 Tax=Leptomonas pyrrhocoris TaxID=157538 RepID=A0A0M9G6E6_LEPPY|nr:putative mitochondrial hypothetical protein [Leptomonas pyrrhocoris]KPA83363.1 putative mitochondrial hypothetical protein [Leptomonas pyrrhocoris]|eukprot:XP_015661802.1 putative mitochondrial hypothetical protein [Leptomonas pyrrhocoris]